MIDTPCGHISRRTQTSRPGRVKSTSARLYPLALTLLARILPNRLWRKLMLGNLQLEVDGNLRYACCKQGIYVAEKEYISKKSRFSCQKCRRTASVHCLQLHSELHVHPNAQVINGPCKGIFFQESARVLSSMPIITRHFELSDKPLRSFIESLGTS